MTSHLENRLQRIEALAPVGRNKMFVVKSHAEAQAQHAAKKASGEIVPGDKVVWLYITAADPETDSDSSAGVQARVVHW